MVGTAQPHAHSASKRFLSWLLGLATVLEDHSEKSAAREIQASTTFASANAEWLRAMPQTGWAEETVFSVPSNWGRGRKSTGKSKNEKRMMGT